MASLMPFGLGTWTDMVTISSDSNGELSVGCTVHYAWSHDWPTATITLSDVIGIAIDHVRDQHMPVIESTSVFLKDDHLGHPRLSVLPLPEKPADPK